MPPTPEDPDTTVPAGGLRLLLIDDDPVLAVMMQEFFARHGHALDTAITGREGIDRCGTQPYDLILLDVMLPMIDGFSTLHRLRRSSHVPVIMLTARTGRNDRILGLTTGADDYVTKPFDPDELLARIFAIRRRTGVAGESGAPPRTFPTIAIDVQRREVRVEDAPIDLTALEFDILEMLTRAPGQVITRQELSTVLLNRPVSADDRALDVHVSRLREKLRGGRRAICTVRGSGYVFAEQVEP